MTNRSTKKRTYKEGDWFAVPLTDGGYAVGLIARYKKRIILGYFFGPMVEQIPSEDYLSLYKPSDAVMVCQFGDLYLYEGKWPIITHSKSWNRNDWPMPPFVRVDSISGEVRKILYSEDDPNHEVQNIPGDPKDLHKYPKDGLFGAKAVEISLTDKL